MGTYRIDIEAVGGHGCMREVKDGAVSPGCGLDNCPDCETRRFVARLKGQGNDVRRASLVHWPETPERVTDDLLTGRRQGSF